MSYRKVATCILFMFLFSIMLSVPKPCYAETNYGVYGTKELPEIALVNWTHFWSFINNHAIWNLEYFDGTDWYQAKEELRIIRSYFVETLDGDFPAEKEYATKCKITLDFTSQHSADYRLTLAIESELREYIYKETQFKYVLSYEEYQVFFDFSDLKSISNLILSHGTKIINEQKWFWFRARRNNVPQGVHVVLDPSFGYETEGASIGALADYIRGSWFLFPDSKGKAENISVYLNVQVQGNFRCAIYRHDDHVLVAETQERNLTTGISWRVFNFSEPKPELRKIEYELVVWGQTLCFIYCDSETSKGGSEYKLYTGNFSETWTPTVHDSKYSIYCMYSIIPEDEETSSGRDSGNGAKETTIPKITVPKFHIPTWGYYLILGSIALVVGASIFTKPKRSRGSPRGIKVKKNQRRYPKRNKKGRFSK